MEQRGAGKGIDSIPKRDREATLANDSNTIVDYPKDMLSLVVLGIFSNTPLTYGQHGITGLNYQALQDQIKWAGLSRKHYTNILQTCVNYYIKGYNSK